MADTSSMSFPMVGGDGPHSYTQNSSLQRNAVESAKSLMNAAIVDNLDVNQLNRVSSSSNSFKIVDLDCSVGPNTFIAVQNIIESVKLVCQCHGLDSEALEFQVLFNNHASNDFNTLFKCLSKGSQYFAAGVLGSFHGRLFPKSYVHLTHSSYSLQWLSKDLLRGAPKEVFEAYEAQFAKDMESFLNARALELVPGGLMALVVPCHPSGTPPSHFSLMVLIQLLEATLNDMASMGLGDEDKVNTFNLYNPTLQELQTLIERNGCFSIEKLEALVHAPAKEMSPEHKVLHLRAGWEGVIKQHFGSDDQIIDKLFDTFNKKAVELPIFSQRGEYKSLENIFVLLKSKVA
ncbi:probable S-adenosylmethionine-dependent methyltransferase At5g37990 [Camellia sinensis]|uniref:probable S-adenosylmethionine-dependent methyltransferase At5g37990 n=1 Tax=Camellia sinensis TaxID=4442 RepID=UPI00103591C2|nr:probable S-adenosylmethionine-dependent methyltransferase At5g37990 [Camellia sinensis]